MDDKTKSRNRSKPRSSSTDKKEKPAADKSPKKSKPKEETNKKKPERKPDSKEKSQKEPRSHSKDPKNNLKPAKPEKPKAAPPSRKPEVRSKSKETTEKKPVAKKPPSVEKSPKKSSSKLASKDELKPSKTSAKENSTEKPKKDRKSSKKPKTLTDSGNDKISSDPTLRQTYVFENGVNGEINGEKHAVEIHREQTDQSLKSARSHVTKTGESRPDAIRATETNQSGEVPPYEPPTINQGAQDDDNYDYEDDFEDYEEDFEEDESDEELKIPQSRDTERKTPEPDSSASESSDEESYSEEMKDEPKELKRLSDSGTTRKTDSADSNTRPQSVQSRIDFSRASLTEVQFGAIVHSRKREREILNLIDMDTVVFDLFDMAPVRDYEFYMQTFGKSDRIQIQTQTGDDRIERDIQTEEVDSETKWTQHPPTDLLGVGGENEVKTYQNSNIRFDTEVFNSQRFQRFVVRTGQLIYDILEEESAAKPMMIQHKCNLNFSEGYSRFSLGSLVKESTVSSVTFSPVQSSVVAISFLVSQSLAEDVVGRGIVGVWKATDPENPIRLFMCDLQPNCCCFSPENNSAVFAGLNDGSVVAWDFFESEYLHSTIPWKDGEIALKSPTYDTSYTSSVTGSDFTESCISSPLVAICSIGAQDVSSAGAGGYQLACLEEHGVVHIWTVIESKSADPSEVDLGLSPGGKLKLVKSATVKPSSVALRCLSPDAGLRLASLQSFTMAQNPRKPSHFYIGTDVGFILHLYRNEERSGPLIYQSELESLSDVLSMDISPFESTLLLAGSSDGSISLYKVSASHPLVTFRLSSDQNGVGADLPVTKVRWCPTSPYVFYAVHGERVLTFWDLKFNKKKPAAMQDLSENGFLACISTNAPAEMAENGKINYLAIGRKNGIVEVHLLERKDRKLTRKEEAHKFLRFVDWTSSTGTWDVETKR